MYLIYLCLSVCLSPQHWDSALTRMWGQAANEYAVLSTSPQDISAMSGSETALDGDFQQVPHLCHHFITEGYSPALVSQPNSVTDLMCAEGSRETSARRPPSSGLPYHRLTILNLASYIYTLFCVYREPLLAASWSPAFSFSKCHLDDKVTVPIAPPHPAHYRVLS